MSVDGKGKRLASRLLASTPGIARNDPVAGIFWTTMSMALFAGLATCGKYAASRGLDPLQVVFFRNFFALLMLTPLFYWRGMSLVRSHALPLYGVRVAVALISMTAWFYALSLIPLGELTAIGFLGPLFGTLAAIVFLGEVVKGRRWTALAVGFLGAMIILRPGLSPIGLGQGLALLAAALAGISSIFIKQLSGMDDPEKIVFLTNAMMMPMSLVPALLVWQWPPADLWPWLVALGVFAFTGHICLVRGFAACDASLVLSFEFSRLPFAVGIAYLLFGELIDMWTWIGAFVIFCSAVYITRREARLKREALEGKSRT